MSLDVFSDISTIEYDINFQLNILIYCFVGQYYVIQIISGATQTPQHKTKGKNCCSLWKKIAREYSTDPNTFHFNDEITYQ